MLIRVAFFTLIERKLIGLIHYRKGPNKVAPIGVSQPLADALKLLTKETTKLSTPKTTIFLAGPMVIIFVILICWGLYETSTGGVITSSLKVLIIITIISTSVYGFIMTRWGSNSPYALIGGYRAIAQTISYEVCIALHIIALVFLFKTLGIYEIKIIQVKLWTAVCTTPLFLSWIMLCLAESNRTPFDLAEGESEIVSGFNVEYGGGLFTLIFIREYGIIIFLRFVTSLIFMGGVFTIIKIIIICIIFIWTRSSFPRVRYDNLIIISWKLATPYSIAIIIIRASI